ncbi:hypothetical protein KEM60_01724 [Austwickia sp. TVS 96-490-7B]|uniref:DUF3349 domain-containing protein n=1 Tax=Austwickia sp. TVS 96-490-7B TaxID=2830843 RepID=UPI001C5654B1|nr:DUF3349 domain-containing protein [Austwickia sp. TVS 96-490-7B]MBW3085524.1 hypothetical protein [Austwickia sp. TVS 96-490-7B]
MSFTFRSILDWLRAGYPQGIPQEDYIALFGVLQRHLTEAEIVQAACELREARGEAPPTEDEVRRTIENILKGHAADEDIQRVVSHLAAGGWPTTADEDSTDNPPS